MSTEKVKVRVESTLAGKEVSTFFKVKLPEYKNEVIVRPEYVDELIEKLTILKKAQYGK